MHCSAVWNVSISVFVGELPHGLERNTCQKKLLEKECTSKRCGGFIGVPERMKTTQITKKHLVQLRLKLGNIKDAM